MDKSGKTVYSYLLRLPCLFAAHCASQIIFRDDILGLFIGMFILHLIMSAAEWLCPNRAVFSAVGIALGLGCVVSGFYAGAAAVAAAMVYRPEDYDIMQIALWAVYYAVMCVLFIALYIEDFWLCALYLVLQTVILLYCRQVDLAWRFAYSEYCRESPRSAIQAAFVRIERAAIPFLAAAFLTGVSAFFWNVELPELYEYTEEEKRQSAALSKYMLEHGKPLFKELEAPQLNDEEAAEPNYDWFKPAANAALILLAVGAAVLIVFFTSRYKKTDKKGFDDYPDELEESDAAAVEHVRRKRTALRFGLNAKIRRMFLSKIRRHSRRGSLKAIPGDTPLTLAGKIAETENIMPLAELYHKARYSGAEVTKEDMAARLNK